jgi:glycosyltransferase involved in cell wall biosynthesis
MSTNSRIALFTPLRPVKSGIADYSEELCPFLNEHYDIDIFIEKYKPENKELKKIVNIYPASEYVWRNLQKPYAVNVYQMGNNTCHAYMYPFVFQYPGILVLHDYNLHHSRLKMAVDMHKLDEYGTEIAYCYPGEKGKVLADTVISGMGSRFQYFKFPYNKILIDASLLTAVHSTYVKAIIDKEAPTAKVAKITMGVPVIKPDKNRVGELRKKHQLQPDDIILASFGAVTPEKRIIPIMKVLQKLVTQHENIKYLLIGNRSEDLDIDQLVKDLNLEDKVIITGFVEREDFFNYLALADICINMRYPTVRETSATLLRIMAMGKPVIISDLLHLGDIPQDIAIKIPLIDEEEILYKKLSNIIKNKSKREKLSHTGLNFIREKHSLKAMCDSYVPVIEEGIKLKSKRQIDRSGFPEHLRGLYTSTLEELKEVFNGFIKPKTMKKMKKEIANILQKISGIV